MKKHLTNILLQIIPVMIGVYLGFLVSDWSAQRQKSQDTDVLISSLLAEIESNRSRISKVVDYHEMLRDSSRYYSQDDVEMGAPKFFKGLRLFKLANSAYSTGVQTGVINELPIDDIQMINELYTFQKDHNEFSSMLMSTLIAKDLGSSDESMKEAARFIALGMTDVVIQERDLMEAYEEVHATLSVE